ncbi:MAG: iron-sulfur cluster assembly scaffold protein [Minisyncoccales bacterium]
MLYSKKVWKHFRHPHNFGKMKNPDAVGQAGNLVCGDLMYLYLKIKKNKKKEEVIKDIKFETLGCAAAIATSSVITDLVKGKTLKEALNFDKNEIIKELGGLPVQKIHCSILATEALKEAIYDYWKKEKKEIPEELKKAHEKIEKEKTILERRYKK